MDFNPNAPVVIGPELTPRTEFYTPFVQPVASPADGVAIGWHSNAAEAVALLGTYVKALRPSQYPWVPNTVGGYVLAETFVSGNEVPANVAQGVFTPNGSSGKVNINGTVADLVPGAGYINLIDNINPGSIHVQFNTAGGSLTGKRILRVRFSVDLYGSALGGTQGAKLNLDDLLDIGTVDLVTGNGVANDDFVTYVFDTGEIDPVASPISPWIYADVEAFDTGSFEIVLHLGIYNGTPFGEDEQVTGQTYARNMVCVVDYCDENRVSTAVQNLTGINDAQQVLWTPKTPTAGTWSKVVGDYTTVIRAPRSGGVGNIGFFGTQVGVVMMPTFTDLPAGFPDYAVAPTLAADGRVLAIGSEASRLACAWEVMTTGPTAVADTQCYAHQTDFGGAPWTTLQQEFTQSTGSPVTIVGVQLLGQAVPSLDGTVADLTVQVKRRSDDVVMASGVYTYDDWVNADVADGLAYNGYALMAVDLGAGFTMASGVQYYVEVTSTVKANWRLPTLRVATSSYSMPAQSWHGTTDRGTWNTEEDRNDFPWLLHQEIDFPADLAGVGVSQPVEVAADLCELVDPDGCLIDSIGAVLLTWTPTTLGGLFAYYEIQRQDQFDEWATIATVDDELGAAFYDFEGRLGLQSSYRLRVVTTAGIRSPWSPTVSATAPVGGTGLTFTTNAVPAWNLAYSDIFDGPAERVWKNLEADEVTMMKMSGRDYQVAFQNCERRGVSWTANLLVNAMSAPSTVGIHAFDALRDLAKLAFPYVCVRDHDGDRWFVVMSVPEVRIREPRDFYTAAVTCTEVQGVPSSVAAATITPPCFAFDDPASGWDRAIWCGHNAFAFDTPGSGWDEGYW